MEPTINVLLHVVLLLASSRAALGSRPVPISNSPAATSSPCLCQQQQQHVVGGDGSASLSLLADAAQTDRHVLMKVRMLPTPAATLLESVKAGLNDSAESWVAAVLNTTAQATAQQLGVPQSMLRVTLESSLGSGIMVPAVATSRQSAAVDALAEFYEQAVGSKALLVGLNMVTNPPQQMMAQDQGGSAAQHSDADSSPPAVLALATLNGAVGDLAQVLRMAGSMRPRCPELFEYAAVLKLTADGPQHRDTTSKSNSSSCAAWLSNWLLPVLTGSTPLKDPTAAKSAVRGAAALHSAVQALPRVAEPLQATVVLPLEVNIKLSIKLSLPQQLQDPEGLIAKARTWLQSAALDKMLQQHGLHIGTGSPAHLVTLMSSPGGEGSRYYHGVDEVLEVYGSSDSTSDSPPDPASTSSSRSPSHPQLQAEMGPGHRHSASTGGVYSHTMALPEASSMSAWGRLQPHELKPLVLGQHPQASTLAGAAAAAQHGAAGSDGGHATSSAEEDEIGRRTVLGAIVGAVLGSAAAGAGLAMAIATAVRRRRAGQQQSGGGSAGGCCNSAAPASCDGDAARSRDISRASSSGRRRRGRKRYLKYLPNMAAAHLLPSAHAQPASPSAGSSSSALSAGRPAAPSTPASEAAASWAVLGNQQSASAHHLVAMPPIAPVALGEAVAAAAAAAAAVAGSSSGLVMCASRNDAAAMMPHARQQSNADGLHAAPALMSMATSSSSSSGQRGAMCPAAALQAPPLPLQQRQTASASPGTRLQDDVPVMPDQHQQQQPHSQSQSPQFNSVWSSRLVRTVERFTQLRQAASDPLQQQQQAPHSRPQQHSLLGGATSAASSGIAQHNSWTATATGSGSVLTRGDLCSDSVSSAARMDLLHALHPSGSAGLSDDGSVSSGSNSSSVSGSRDGHHQTHVAVAAGAGSSHAREGVQAAVVAESSGGHAAAEREVVTAGPRNAEHGAGSTAAGSGGVACQRSVDAAASLSTSSQQLPNDADQQTPGMHAGSSSSTGDRSSRKPPFASPFLKYNFMALDD